MEIKSARQATRAMTVAFKIATKMAGKSDSRRTEIKKTAKSLIEAAENYMILERVKHSPGITKHESK